MGEKQYNFDAYGQKKMNEFFEEIKETEKTIEEGYGPEAKEAYIKGVEKAIFEYLKSMGLAVGSEDNTIGGR